MIMKLLLSNSLPQDILSSEGNPQCPAEQLWQVISKPFLPAVVSALELRPKKKKELHKMLCTCVFTGTHT
jgi:hypothetical protein